MSDLASAYVEIHADTSGFSAELRTKLDAIMTRFNSGSRGGVRVNVGADVRGAQATIKALIASINRQRAEFHVDANVDSATRSIESLSAAIGNLKDEINVGANVNEAIREAVDAAATIDALHATIKVDSDTSTANDIKLAGNTAGNTLEQSFARATANLAHDIKAAVREAFAETSIGPSITPGGAGGGGLATSAALARSAASTDLATAALARYNGVLAEGATKARKLVAVERELFGVEKQIALLSPEKLARYNLSPDLKNEIAEIRQALLDTGRYGDGLSRLDKIARKVTATLANLGAASAGQSGKGLLDKDSLNRTGDDLAFAIDRAVKKVGTSLDGLKTKITTSFNDSAIGRGINSADAAVARFLGDTDRLARSEADVAKKALLQAAAIDVVTEAERRLLVARVEANRTAALFRKTGSDPDLDAAAAAKNAVTEATRGVADAKRALGSLSNEAESGVGIIGKLTGSLKGLNFFGLGPVGIAALATAASIAAVGAAALGTEAAVAALGVTGAEKLRTLELGLSNTGLAGADLESAMKRVKALAETGLGIDAVTASVTDLIHAGENSSTAVATVKAIGDALAGGGLVGKNLASAVTATTTALVALGETKKVTGDQFDAAVNSLGLGVKPVNALKELEKQLGLTKKQVQDLADAGKLSGEDVANSALAAAAKLPNSKNGLDNAAATSFTQAVLGAVQKAKDSLGTVFSDPALVKSVSDFGDKIGAALDKFGPQAAKDFPVLLGNIGRAIGPIADNLLKVAGGISDFFTQANTKGTATNEFFAGLSKSVKGVVDVVQLAIEFSKPLFATLAPVARVAGDILKVIGDLAETVRRLAQPFDFIISGVLSGALSLVADDFDLIASAADKLRGVAVTIERAFIHAFDTVLNAIEGIIKGANKALGLVHLSLPGADDAINVIEGIKASLAGLPPTVTVQLSAVLTPGTAENLAAFGSSDFNNVHGFTSSSDAITAELNRQGIGNKPAAPTGGGGGSGLNAAADKAAAAAQAAKDKLSTALSDMKTKLSTLLADISTDTPKQIRTALNSISKAFASDAHLEGLSGNAISKVTALIAKDSLKLQAIAKQRLAVEKAIAAGDAAVSASFDQAQAFTSLTSIADALASAATSATSAVNNLPDLSRLRIILPGQDSLATVIPGTAAISAQQASLAAIQKLLDQRVAQINKFNSDVKAAEAKGLRADVASDLFKGGPEQDSALAATIASGSAAQIAAINKSAGAALDAAKAVSKSAGDALASEAQNAGQQVVAGILKGLEDKDGKLKDALVALGKFVSDTVKKQLHIKSPSRVMQTEVGHQVLAGLHLGMTSGPHLARIADAAQSAAERAVPVIKPIGLPELVDMGGKNSARELAVALDIGGRNSDVERRHQEVVGHLARIGAVEPAKREYRPTPPPVQHTTVVHQSDINRMIRGLR